MNLNGILTNFACLVLEQDTYLKKLAGFGFLLSAQANRGVSDDRERGSLIYEESSLT